MFIEAARARGEALDHVLLAGPPGPRQDLAGADRGQRARAPSSCPPPARRSSARATWPATSRRSSRAASSSSTRSTACRARSRRPSIRRWRTASCRSPSARARARGWSRSTCPTFTLIGATTRTGPAHHAAARPLRRHAPARALRAGRPRAGSCCARPASSTWRSTTPGAEAIAARSRGTPRVANRLLKRVRDFAEVRGAGPHRRARGARGARPARGRRGRPRPARPRDPARDLREVRRRPGRAVHARGRGGRGARHDRGRLRALPAPAGLPDAHARAGGWPPTPRSPTSASSAPRDGAQRLF